MNVLLPNFVKTKFIELYGDYGKVKVTGWNDGEHRWGTGR